jgi:hypothetical protein
MVSDTAFGATSLPWFRASYLRSKGITFMARLRDALIQWCAQNRKRCQQLSCDLSMLSLPLLPRGWMFEHGIEADEGETVSTFRVA